MPGPQPRWRAVQRAEGGTRPNQSRPALKASPCWEHGGRQRWGRQVGQDWQRHDAEVGKLCLAHSGTPANRLRNCGWRPALAQWAYSLWSPPGCCQGQLGGPVLDLKEALWPSRSERSQLSAIGDLDKKAREDTRPGRVTNTSENRAGFQGD